MSMTKPKARSKAKRAGRKPAPPRVRPEMQEAFDQTLKEYDGAFRRLAKL